MPVIPIGRIGQDFIVDTTGNGDQRAPSIATLGDGRFIVAWESQDTFDGSGDCVRARIFNADGTPLGGDDEDFILDKTTDGVQVAVSVVGLPNGRFFAAWQSDDPGDGSLSCIRGRSGDADGTLDSFDFVLDSTATGNQVNPVATALPDGNFVVSWQSADTNPSSIRAGRFADGVGPLTNDFAIATTGLKAPPAIATLADGGFVVAWASDDASGTDPQGIRARLFTAAGAPLAGSFEVNSTTAEAQISPSLATLTDGHVVVAWTSQDPGDGSGFCIRARVFDGAGTPLANDFVVDSTGTGTQQAPVVAALADGRFVVVWQSADTEDGAGGCVRARVFNPDGSSDAEDFIVETTTTGNQTSPSVTAFTDGRFAVTWASQDSGDGFGTCIRAAIFDPTIFIGTDAAETWHGGNLADRISGGADADHLDGRAGDDFVNGDAGNDVLIGGLGNDHLFGGGDNDTINGNIGADFLSGGGGNDNLFGDAANDVIDGGGGDDLLNGGTGADFMAGEAGDDTYVVDNAGDVVDETTGEGPDTVLASVSFILGNAAHARGQVENLTLIGAANINGGGNGLANVISGNAGKNVLAGGGDNDTLNGLARNDTLSGGPGHDSFVFSTALNAATNVDRIIDFAVPADTVVLENAIFHGLPGGVLAATAFFRGAAAHDGNDRIIYNPANGFVIFDANGSAAGGGVHFATLAAHLAVTHADFVIV